jgi:N-alpha-acetyltransferase 50
MEHSRLYIMTLGILSPYRRMGLGSELVSHVVSSASTANTSKVAIPATKKPSTVGKKSTQIDEIYIHVHEGDEEAIGFWEKVGFEKKEKLDKYYQRLKPSGAWVMEKKVEIKEEAQST